MTKTPLIIVSGYLGAGKTTLINDFLATTHNVKAAVLVNDFGAINIDAELIENNTGQTIALTNGCVCCSIGDDLFEAAQQVMSMSPDVVILEASGVSEPLRLSRLLSGVANLQNAVIATTINAEKFRRNSKDKFIANLFKSQISTADFIALNRVNMCSESDREKIAQTVGDKPIFDSLETLLDKAFSSRSNTSQVHHIEHAKHQTLTLDIRSEIDPKMLENWCANLPDTIARAKGIVKTSDGIFRLDYVQGTVTIAPYAGKIAESLGKIVLIGFDLDTVLHPNYAA